MTCRIGCRRTHKWPHVCACVPVRVSAYFNKGGFVIDARRRRLQVQHYRICALGSVFYDFWFYHRLFWSLIIFVRERVKTIFLIAFNALIVLNRVNWLIRCDIYEVSKFIWICCILCRLYWVYHVVQRVPPSFRRLHWATTERVQNLVERQPQLQSAVLLARPLTS